MQKVLRGSVSLECFFSLSPPLSALSLSLSLSFCLGRMGVEKAQGMIFRMKVREGRQLGDFQEKNREGSESLLEEMEAPFVTHLAVEKLVEAMGWVDGEVPLFAALQSVMKLRSTAWWRTRISGSTSLPP